MLIADQFAGQFAPRSEDWFGAGLRIVPFVQDCYLTCRSALLPSPLRSGKPKWVALPERKTRAVPTGKVLRSQAARGLVHGSHPARPRDWQNPDTGINRVARNFNRVRPGVYML